MKRGPRLVAAALLVGLVAGVVFPGVTHADAG